MGIRSIEAIVDEDEDSYLVGNLTVGGTFLKHDRVKLYPGPSRVKMIEGGGSFVDKTGDGSFEIRIPSKRMSQFGCTFNQTNNCKQEEPEKGGIEVRRNIVPTQPYRSISKGSFPRSSCTFVKNFCTPCKTSERKWQGCRRALIPWNGPQALNGLVENSVEEIKIQNSRTTKERALRNVSVREVEKFFEEKIASRARSYDLEKTDYLRRRRAKVRSERKEILTERRDRRGGRENQFNIVRNRRDTSIIRESEDTRNKSLGAVECSHCCANASRNRQPVESIDHLESSNFTESSSPVRHDLSMRSEELRFIEDPLAEIEINGVSWQFIIDPVARFARVNWNSRKLLSLLTDNYDDMDLRDDLSIDDTSIINEGFVAPLYNRPRRSDTFAELSNIFESENSAAGCQDSSGKPEGTSRSSQKTTKGTLTSINDSLRIQKPHETTVIPLIANQSSHTGTCYKLPTVTQKLPGITTERPRLAVVPLISKSPGDSTVAGSQTGAFNITQLGMDYATHQNLDQSMRKEGNHQTPQYDRSHPILYQADRSTQIGTVRSPLDATVSPFGDQPGSGQIDHSTPDHPLLYEPPSTVRPSYGEKLGDFERNHAKVYGIREGEFSNAVANSTWKDQQKSSQDAEVTNINTSLDSNARSVNPVLRSAQQETKSKEKPGLGSMLAIMGYINKLRADVLKNDLAKAKNQMEQLMIHVNKFVAFPSAQSSWNKDTSNQGHSSSGKVVMMGEGVKHKSSNDKNANRPMPVPKSALTNLYLYSPREKETSNDASKDSVLVNGNRRSTSNKVSEISTINDTIDRVAEVKVPLDSDSVKHVENIDNKEDDPWQPLMPPQSNEQNGMDTPMIEPESSENLRLSESTDVGANEDSSEKRTNNPVADSNTVVVPNPACEPTIENKKESNDGVVEGEVGPCELLTLNVVVTKEDPNRKYKDSSQNNENSPLKMPQFDNVHISPIRSDTVDRNERGSKRNSGVEANDAKLSAGGTENTNADSCASSMLNVPGTDERVTRYDSSLRKNPFWEKRSQDASARGNTRDVRNLRSDSTNLQTRVNEESDSVEPFGLKYPSYVATTMDRMYEFLDKFPTEKPCRKFRPNTYAPIDTDNQLEADLTNTDSSLYLSANSDWNLDSNPREEKTPSDLDATDQLPCNIPLRQESVDSYRHVRRARAKSKKKKKHKRKHRKKKKKRKYKKNKSRTRSAPYDERI